MNVNIFAAIVVVIVNMIVGFVWYGPLFAKRWTKETGITDDDMKGNPGVGYSITSVCALVAGLVMSQLVHITNTTDVVNGALLGLAIGVGFVATSLCSTYIFSKKSLALYLIDGGYHVTVLFLAGIICTLIR